jgi:hypothetical protein
MWPQDKDEKEDEKEKEEENDVSEKEKSTTAGYSLVHQIYKIEKKLNQYILQPS